jgi:hypothetical protein
MSEKDLESRIREAAYRLWEAEGWPDGRADLHWAAAKEIVALKESYAGTLRRLDDTTRDPAEPTVAFENQGEMPTLTDQGEGQAGPSRTAATESSGVLPLSSRQEIDELEGRNTLQRGIDTAFERLRRKRSG